MSTRKRINANWAKKETEVITNKIIKILKIETRAVLMIEAKKH